MYAGGMNENLNRANFNIKYHVPFCCTTNESVSLTKYLHGTFKLFRNSQLAIIFLFRVVCGKEILHVFANLDAKVFS
jgi:hypothetical protein